MDGLWFDSFCMKKNKPKGIGVAKKYDEKESERGKTAACKKSLLRENDHPKCADCSANNVDLDAAHIEPIEVGGVTEKTNLILLCKDCHENVHEGLTSINQLKELKKSKNGRTANSKAQHRQTKHVPEAAQTIDEEIRPWTQKRSFAKAVDLIKCGLFKINDDEEAKYYLLIKQAELMRRCAGKGMRDKALKLLNCKIFPKINELDIVNKLRFYNERAFIHRLIGCHKQAIIDSQMAIDLTNDNYGHDYITASLCKLTCELAGLDRAVVKAAEFIDDLYKLQKIVDAFTDKYWKGRCILNITSNKLKVYIKANDNNMSWQTLTELRDLYFKSDISNGWTESIMDTVSQLSGLVHIIFPKEKEDLEKAQRLLARSFNARINNNEYFGDIRDIGFGLAKALDARGKKDDAREIRAVMCKTIDGSSFLHPLIRKCYPFK